MNTETLDGLVARWRQVRQEGRAVSADELCRDRPDLLAALNRRIAELLSAERTKSQAANTPDECGQPTAAFDAPLPDLSRLLQPARQADEIGRFGDYRILRVLGRGGMGVVFEAEDVALGRRVALKLMNPEVATREDARLRFSREARAAAAVSHDNIVPIYAVGEVDGVPYLAMQRLSGESLADRLHPNRTLSLDDIRRVALDVAAGLSAAHDAGLIHRDIKPANIWLETDGAGGPVRRARLLDFGLARAHTSEPLTSPGSVLGTPAYMAPEQIDGQPLDGRSDLFAFGVVLYRAATGRLPFDGPTMTAVFKAIATHTPPPPHKLRPDLPPPVSQLIQRLLAKDPAGRPASAVAVAEALRAPGPRWRPLRWFAAAGVVAAALAVAFLSRNGRPSTQAVAEVPAGPNADASLDALRAEIRSEARNILMAAKRVGHDSVWVEEFAGPADSEGDGGMIIALMFRAELQAAGLKVQPEAQLRLTGRYTVEPAGTAKLWSAQIVGQLSDATAVQHKVHRTILDERALAARLCDVIDPRVKAGPRYAALTRQLVPVARDVADRLRGMFIREIRLVGFREATDDEGEKPLAHVVLTELLGRLNVVVRRGAAIGVQGEWLPRESKLACKFVESSGKLFAELPHFNVATGNVDAGAAVELIPEMRILDVIETLTELVREMVANAAGMKEGHRGFQLDDVAIDGKPLTPQQFTALDDAIKKLKVKVAADAPLRFRLKADVAKEGAKPRFEGSVYDRTGKVLFTCGCSSIEVPNFIPVGPEIVRVELPPDDLPADVMPAKDVPPAGGNYVVDFLLGDPPSPRGLVINSGTRFVPLVRGEAVKVRFQNDSDVNVAVGVYVDGLSFDHFATNGRADSPPGYVLVKRGRSAIIDGWDMGGRVRKPFVVGDHRDSAAYGLRSSARSGAINLSIHSAWPKDGRPPGDEPAPTQVGETVDGHRVGVVRKIWSFNYVRNAPDDTAGTSISFRNADRLDGMLDPRLPSP